MTKAITLLTLLALLLVVEHADATKPAGKLVYSRSGNLYVANITAQGGLQPGTVPRRILHLPQRSEVTAASVSADGSLIVLCVTTTLSTDSQGGKIVDTSLWAVAERVGAQPRRLGPGAEPSFAPTGKQFVYEQEDIAHDERVCIWDLATGKKRVFRPHAHTPRWSADGKEISLIDDSKQAADESDSPMVMAIDAATGKQIRYRNEVINVQSPLISPNGRYIAYKPHMSRPKLPGEIADRKTGDEIALPHEGGSILDWSADSRWLLWTRLLIDPHNSGSYLWEEVWATTPDGSRSCRFGAGATGRFAPDGRHVLYLRTTADEDQKPLGLYLADMQGYHRKLQVECDSLLMVWKAR
jgi:hypothetical protein